MPDWKRISRFVQNNLRELGRSVAEVAKHVALLTALAILVLWAGTLLSNGRHGTLTALISPNGRPPLDVLASILAICGIVYAVRQEMQSKVQAERLAEQLRQLGLTEQKIATQVEKLDEHSKSLQKIDDSLSTVRMEAFPHFITQLCNLFSKSSSLDILIDCVDYGSFFDPPGHQSFHLELLKVAENGTLRILVCGQLPEPMTQSRSDFGSLEVLTTIYLDYLRKEESDFISFVERFAKAKPGFLNTFKDTFLDKSLRHDPHKELKTCISWLTSAPSTPVDATAEHDKLALEVLEQVRQIWFGVRLRKCKAQVLALPKAEQMFLWLRDREAVNEDNRAAFTFAVAARGRDQFGYRTRDSDFLKTFRTLFDEKWDLAQKLQESEEGPVWPNFLEVCEQHLWDAKVAQE